jgi:hypothetical protein
MARTTFSCSVFFALIVLTGCKRETVAPPAEPAGSTTTAAATTAATTTPEDMKAAAVDTVVPLRPDVIARCEAGSVLGADGAVSAAKTSFTPKDPLHVSLWLEEAPEGLQVSVKLIDAGGTEVANVPRNAEKLKVVTLKIPTPKEAGRYKLEGYWGGNVVCEKNVDVTK